MIKPIALAGTVALVACGPYSVFIPYDPAPSKVAGPPKPHAGIALAAVEVFEADVAYLHKAQGVRIGDVDGNTSENGLCQAARSGGTHVVRKSTFRKVLASSSATTPGRNFLGQPDGSLNTSTRTVEAAEETQHFVVIRVERESGRSSRPSSDPWTSVPTRATKVPTTSGGS